MKTGQAVGLNAFSWFGGMEFLRRKWFPVLGLFLFLSLAQAVSAIEPATKNVLVLYGFTDRSVFGPPEFLESALRSRVPWPVNFYVEYLEGRRFESDAAYEKNLVENLRYTYGSEKLDLVLVAAYPALQFAVRHRAELFPGVPIVCMEVHAGRLAGQKMWPGVTGVTETVDVPGTINLALRLHPRTNTVAIITNNSPFEKYWLAAVHAELLQHQEKVREINLVGLFTDRLMERVATLPVDTVVLFQRAPQESIHAAIGPHEALESIGKRLPIYCTFPSLLNHVGMGGSETSGEEEMSLAAGSAGRVLAGERPENIPVVSGPAQLRVDWNQLRRWKIPESALPGDTLVLHRPLTLWGRDRNYILAAIALIVAQSLLIIGLLWQRARKRKAEAVLRESEQRFRAMADSAPSLIWMADQEGKITYLNSRGVEFTGRDAAAGYGDTWEEYVHPDDLKRVLAAQFPRFAATRTIFQGVSPSPP
jgi:PAS domain-containing protein